MRFLRVVLAMWVCAGVAVAARAEDDLQTLNAEVGKLHGQGDLAGATKVAEQAVKLAEQRFGEDAAETATPINNLAFLYRVQAQYAQAEPLCKRGLTIQEKSLGPDHPDMAGPLNNLAELYRAQGQYAQAEPLYTRALAIREKSLGPNHVGTGLSLNNLAMLYEARGQYALSEPLYTRVLAIYEKSLGRDHSETAAVLNNLAGLYARQGQYAEAEPLFTRALAIWDKSLGPDHPITATSLDNLAELYRAQGRYAQAEPLSKRALAINEKTLGPDHPDTATTLNNLAALYQDQGQYAQAEPLCARALAIWNKSLGPDHPITAKSLNNLAATQAALGRWPGAAELFDHARRGARRHVARVLPSLTAAEQAVFLRTQDQAHLRGALTLGLLQPANPEIATLSAGWLANGKAVAQEAASQRVILARQSGDPKTATLVQSLVAVRNDLAKLSQVTPDPKQAEAYRTKIISLQDQEQKLVHEIGGQIAALDRAEPWIEIEAIRRNVPAGSVLVDIARFDVFDFQAQGEENSWHPARYAAWIVPPAGAGDVRVIDLGPADAIDAAVTACREAIEAVERSNSPQDEATAEDSFREAATPLAEKVLWPILDRIGPAAEIIVVPDGMLWLIPWQALPLADRSYAIERFAIRTLTSSRDLVPATAAETDLKPSAPLIVADPDYDSLPSGSRSASGETASAGRIDKAKSLPATRREAESARKPLATLAGVGPVVKMGREAAEGVVKKEVVRPQALLLATHGFFLPDQPTNPAARPSQWAARGVAGTRPLVAPATAEAATGPLDPLLRCGLLLAGANLTAAGQSLGDDDGILTGAEIVGLDLLGTDLVVLSACETGVGKVQNGEGVAGLRQAFQIAGATSVVATLWQVPDEESEQIMRAFYANLAKGQPASRALREAQLAFIKARRDSGNSKAAHPYLWAAYGVTGR